MYAARAIVGRVVSVCIYTLNLRSHAAHVPFRAPSTPRGTGLHLRPAAPAHAPAHRCVRPRTGALRTARHAILADVQPVESACPDAFAARRSDGHGAHDLAAQPAPAGRGRLDPRGIARQHAPSGSEPDAGRTCQVGRGQAALARGPGRGQWIPRWSACIDGSIATWRSCAVRTWESRRWVRPRQLLPRRHNPPVPAGR